MLALLDFLFSWETPIWCFDLFLWFYTEGRAEYLEWWINDAKWSWRHARISRYAAVL